MLNLSKEQFKVGIYIRLSREDGDKQESESIGNQRNIIKRFLKEKDLEFVDEYVDDGVSGTTFDRKGFNRLIQDIESKKINMVITKDMSRLGRDYIKVGYYIENYFPEKSVRYVAILDGIDTYLDSTNNDISPFKAIMNDMYAKDISKKIKSVFREKQKSGQFLGSIAPYGYKLSKDEKGKLKVDECTSKIVQDIFKMYSNGHGSIDIMNYLNNKKILNPSSYRKNIQTNNTQWNQITILSILKNQAYIGNIVQNKKRKISYKSKKVISNPTDKWIKVINTHESIIDNETFEKVQIILQSRDTARFTKHEYLLKGFLKCHHCGRNLQIALKGSGGNPYINCIGHEKRGKHPISMNYWKFEENILQVIRNICNMYLDEKVFFEAYKKYKNSYGDLIKKYERDLQQVETRIEYINSNIDKIYFDKLNEIISIDDYMRYRHQFSEEKVILIDKQYDIKQKIETIKEKENENINEQEINKVVKEFLQMKEIDKMLLYRILNYIEIDTNKNIYIHFNMNQLNIIGDSMEIADKPIEYEKILKTG